MPRRSPDEWDRTYREKPVEQMPWYHPDLDPDLALELDRRRIKSGSFLDLCTGPGTQAIELAKRGFRVTGADVSKAAIERLKKLDTDVEFIVKDFLEPPLARSWDYIFDRGCFHMLLPEERSIHPLNVSKMLNDGGLLFLKCYSHRETRPKGPFRFSPDELRGYFEELFIVEEIRESVYHGAMENQPITLFAVMRKR